MTVVRHNNFVVTTPMFVLSVFELCQLCIVCTAFEVCLYFALEVFEAEVEVHSQSPTL